MGVTVLLENLSVTARTDVTVLLEHGFQAGLRLPGGLPQMALPRALSSLECHQISQQSYQVDLT